MNFNGWFKNLTVNCLEYNEGLEEKQKIDVYFCTGSLCIIQIMFFRRFWGLDLRNRPPSKHKVGPWLLKEGTSLDLLRLGLGRRFLIFCLQLFMSMLNRSLVDFLTDTFLLKISYVLLHSSIWELVFVLLAFFWRKWIHAPWVWVEFLFYWHFSSINDCMLPGFELKLGCSFRLY